MIDYAEITVRNKGDEERLREMTRNGWRVVTTATKNGIKTYFLERVPTCYPKEDKEHANAWGHKR